MKRLILIFLCFQTFSPIAMGKCLSGIYTAGLSADSTAYKISKSDTTYSELATDSSVGIKVGSLIYCTKSRVESTYYLKVRSFDFESKKDLPEYKEISDKHTLFSGGIEYKWNFIRKFELVGDFEAREELAFTPHDDTKTFSDDTFYNLKAMTGLRYYTFQNERTDITLAGKLGPLVPLSHYNNSQFGYLYGLSSEILQRMGRKHSLQMDLFWEHYVQRYTNVLMSRRELGLRLSYVFRM